MFRFDAAGLPAYLATQLKAARATVALFRLAHWAGLVTFVIGYVALIGFTLDIETLWRPMAPGRAMHPFTAISFVMGGAAVMLIRPYSMPRSAVLLLCGMGAVSLVRLLEVGFGFSVLARLTPFADIVQREAAQGTPLVWGWNCAAMFLFIAAALLLRSARRPRASQIVCALALFPPLVSLTGYFNGVAEFHGQMSVTTTIGGVLLAPTPALLGARSGIMRAICSPWDGGRLARLQIAIIGGGVFFGGLALRQVAGDGLATLPAFVVFAIICASTTIAWCAVVIEKNDRLRRRAERKLARLAASDPLSGLRNRQFLDDATDVVLAAAQRRRQPVSVLMFDIDRFKVVNDTFGHAAGDEVIRRVAEVIKGRIRCSDIAVRYGGEEMLVVLIGADQKAAIEMAEEIRAAVAAIEFVDRDPAFGRVTLSAGVASLVGPLPDAIERADRALYAAKRAGRNRVCVEEGPADIAPPQKRATAFAAA